MSFLCLRNICSIIAISILQGREIFGFPVEFSLYLGRVCKGLIGTVSRERPFKKKQLNSIHSFFSVKLSYSSE